MARSIVLRFDAQCFDCGRSLSAGTTARWFGRGRVSCCGGRTGDSTLPPGSQSSASGSRNVNGSAFGTPDVPSSAAPALPPRGVPVPLSSMLPPRHSPAPAPQASAPQASGPNDENSLPPGLRGPSSTHYGNGKPVATEPAPDSVLGQALQTGLSAQQAGQLGVAFPMVRLVVRLQSGARFVVRAEHVVHLCACITESCRDRIRDVMREARD